MANSDAATRHEAPPAPTVHENKHPILLDHRLRNSAAVCLLHDEMNYAGRFRVEAASARIFAARRSALDESRAGATCFEMVAHLCPM